MLHTCANFGGLPISSHPRVQSQVSASLHNLEHFFTLSHSLPLHDSHLNIGLLIAKIQVNLARNKANKMIDKIYKLSSSGLAWTCSKQGSPQMQGIPKIIISKLAFYDLNFINNIQTKLRALGSPILYPSLQMIGYWSSSCTFKEKKKKCIADCRDHHRYINCKIRPSNVLHVTICRVTVFCIASCI